MKLTTGEMIADAAKKWIAHRIKTILWFMVLASIAPIC